MNLFIDNKYARWYFALCWNALKRGQTKPGPDYHHHHIIPDAMGGPTTSENMAWLTFEEHYVAHKLLPRFCASWEDRRNMNCAIQFFQSNSNVKNSRTFALEQRRISREGASESKKLNISKGKMGKKFSDEHRRNLSESKRGKPQNLDYGAIAKKSSEAQSRRYFVIDPDGQVHDVWKLKAFCKERGINYVSMCCLAKGTYKSYKGWTCVLISKDASFETSLASFRQSS